MQNKIIFLLLCLVSVSAAWSACDRPVNPKQVVLFLDTNLGGKEVEAASKAACARGETFMAVPSFEPGGLNKKAIPAVLNAVMKDLASKNVAVTSLVISGHDGGGYTMGPNGYIKKEDMVTIMKRAYQDKPQLLSQLHTVLMWGCYSSTPEEVLDWKTMLPDLKILGGFFGSAPSSAQPIDRTILYDLLVKGDALSRITDQERLKTAMNRVTNFGQTSAGLFVRADCAPEGVLYSQTPTGHRYQRLQEAVACTERDRATVTKYRAVVQKYFSGSAEIPTWTDHSDLRDAYSFARQLEHCLNDNEFFLTPDRVGHLLFWNGIRMNFQENFKAQMLAGQKVLSTLGVRPVSPNMKDFSRLLSEAKMSLGPKGVSEMFELPRDQLALKLSKLSALTNHPALREQPALANIMKPLIKAYQLGDRYLYRLSPECMDFLPWHEHHPGRPPLARCR